MSLDSVKLAFSNIHALMEHALDALSIQEATASHPAYLVPARTQSRSKEDHERHLSSISKVVQHSIECLKLSHEHATLLAGLKERIEPILAHLGIASLLTDVEAPRAASGGGSSSPSTTTSDPASVSSRAPELIEHLLFLEPSLEGKDLYLLSLTCSLVKSMLETQKSSSGVLILNSCLQTLVAYSTQIAKSTCESSCLNILRLIPSSVLESMLETFFHFPENRFNRSVKEALIARLHPELLIEYYERHKACFLPFQKKELKEALFAEKDLDPGELISLCKEHDFLAKSPEASNYLKRSIAPHIEIKYIGMTFREAGSFIKAHWQITLDTGALFGIKKNLWTGPTALEKSDDGFPLIPQFLKAAIIDTIHTFMNKPYIEKLPIVILLKPTPVCPFPGCSPTYPGFTFPLAQDLLSSFSHAPVFIEHAGSLPLPVFTAGTKEDTILFLS